MSDIKALSKSTNPVRKTQPTWYCVGFIILRVEIGDIYVDLSWASTPVHCKIQLLTPHPRTAFNRESITELKSG